MSEEDALWAAIDAAPLDKLPRLVFCDWLDEQRDPRADGMRVLAEYDRWPWRTDYANYWCSHTLPDHKLSLHRLAVANHHSDRSELPDVWLDSIARDGDDVWTRHETRLRAFVAASLAWNGLTAEQKAECLAKLDLITYRVGVPACR